ncbi:MAG: hypothetical protein E6Q85_05875 [Thiothrix sp.]|jgi:hypothetical protein|nr:MAG: hypothetical protein E6Q85_05875 [Thiothrix sp.]
MLTPIQNGQIRTKTISSIEPVEANQYDERDLRRNADRFVNFALPKTLYQQMARLVGNFLQQIVGREADNQTKGNNKPEFSTPRVYKPISTAGQPREVRGIADRMPRLVDPEDPFPNKDLILLGEAKDYSSAVIAVQFDDVVKPVFYEGNQVVARHLYLDSTRPSIKGLLVLADGGRIPVTIRVITAV